MKNYRTKYFGFLASAALLFMFAGFLGAEVPPKINFQGRLVERGVPVTGLRSFIFRLYPGLTGGTAVWTSQTQGVNVVNGVFSVVLQTGTVVNLSTGTFTVAKYVEVEVGGVTLAPRQELLSDPYALVAQSLADDARVNPASLDPGMLGGGVIASSVAFGVVHTGAIKDNAVEFSKIGPNGCLADQVIARNGVNNAWECVTSAGVSGGITLAPASPDSDTSTNSSIYVEDVGGGDLMQLLQNGVTRFRVDNAGVVYTDVLSSPRLALSDNVYVSSEADPLLGAGVNISSNVYIVGFSSAAKYYGDGSALTNIPGGADNLGNHIAELTLDMSSQSIVNVASGTFYAGVTASSFTAFGEGIEAVRLRLAGNVYISSETSPLVGAGVNVSSNIYIVGFSSATKYYGDGSALTGIDAHDNLGNHIATTTLDMDGQSIVNAASGTFSSGITASSFTALGDGVSTLRLRYSDAVQISLENDPTLGAGITVSSNVYMVGYASAAAYYGLFGDFTDGVSASSFTARGAGVSAARLRLYENVYISSETDPLLGAGVNISTNVYMVGFSSAAAYYGLAGTFTYSASAPRLQMAEGVAISTETGLVLGEGGVTVSTNVYVLGFSSAAAHYGVLGSFTGAVTASSFTALGEGVAAARLRLAEGVVISSETPTGPDDGGVTVSTNVYVQGLISAPAHYGVSGAFTGAVTASSFTALGEGVAAANLRLADAVHISSETDPALGAGVNVSTNMYVVGFSSAARYYGDGSTLSGVLVRTYVTRTLPAPPSSVQIGEFITSNPGGAHSFHISVTVNEVGWSLVKQYVVPIAHDMTNGDWLDVAPVSNSGCFAGNISNDCTQDFTLELKVDANRASLRLRKSSGFSAGVAMIGISQMGPAGSTFTPESSVVVSQQHSLLPNTVLTQVDSKVGIGNLGPTTKLHLSSGTITIDGDNPDSLVAVGNIYSPHLQLAPNVIVSSETRVEVGAGVTISTNVYIVGFSSATRFFGDGSGLTNVTAGQTADEVTVHSTNGQLSAMASSVTLQGNAFNGADQLVKLDAAGKLPAIDGSQLINIVHPVEVPSGAVMHFNLASCPSGWSEIVAARGRYIVGLTNGGNLLAAVGTALNDQEDRPVGAHLHSITTPAHNHNLPSIYAGGDTPNDDFGLSVREVDISIPMLTMQTFNGGASTFNSASTGAVAGTNAPYLQLLTCQRD
ncbi:MAG: hypothetical protein NDI60_07085 [Elusimicrobiales bacterium]|nr:hypothetical protein [Elusimicrobiales bacterium]